MIFQKNCVQKVLIVEINSGEIFVISVENKFMNVLYVKWSLDKMTI